MRTHRKRLSLLVAAGLLLLVSLALFVWRVDSWTTRGSVGLAFTPAVEHEVPRAFAAPAGTVLIVAPGSPAARAGIVAGDVILSLDGVPVSDLEGLHRLAGERRRGDAVVYRLATAEGGRETALTLASPYESPLRIASMAVSVGVGLVFLVISLLVAWQQPRSEAAYVFFLFSGVSAGLFLFHGAVELDLLNVRGFVPFGTDPWLWAGFAIYAALAMVMTSLLLHLSLLFPHPRPVTRRWPEVFGWLHALPFWLPAAFALSVFTIWAVRRIEAFVPVVLLLLLGAAAAGRHLWRARRRAARGRRLWQVLAANPWATLGLALALAGLAAPLLRLASETVRILILAFELALTVGGIFVFLAVWSILTLIAFYRGYREATAEEKLQIRWPLWGTLVSTGGGLVWMLAILALEHIVEQPIPLRDGLAICSKLLYLPIPLSFAFGILKYRLMKVDVLLEKTLVYSGVTGFVLLAFLVLAGGLGFLLVSLAGVESPAVTVVATLAVVALVLPVKNRLQAFVDRRFPSEEKERSRRELDEAYRIQRGLLPAVLPQRPGMELAARWRPAHEVAGDYYDALELPGGALGLCIGDVVGKGLPAALLMSSLQAAVKAVAPLTDSACEVCVGVRRVVVQNLSGGKFVTFFYARLEGRRLVYANAGHNPPVLVRADGTAERLETGGGVMARFFANLPLAQGETALLPGDRLVLFTDGVSEARGVADEEFGEERLVELVRASRSLAAEELCERIVGAVAEFCGGRFQDDVTVLVMAL